MAAEKRRHPRVPCELGSSYNEFEPSSPRRHSETNVQDISEGGIRFRTPYFIPVQNRLMFKINIPNQKIVDAMVQSAWIREVPRLSQYEIGARFLSLSEEDRGVIRQFTSGAYARA